jgi:putative hydrolase of the HAD superfamily
LVTDLTTQIQLRKLIYFELESSFDLVVTSEEVGVEKPDGRIFNYALSKVTRGRGPVWMIGDSIEKDMIGAKQAVNAHTFLRGGMLRRVNRQESVDTVFKDFWDLLPLIKGISSAVFESASNVADFNLTHSLSSNE